VTTLPRPVVDPREASGKLLARRPDLSAHRSQRRRARELVESVGNDAAATEVLAGWLGLQLDSDVGDLELVLSDRVQVRLASLSREERRDGSTEEARAREALRLGWDQLLDDAARRAVRVVAAAGDHLLPSVLHRAVVDDDEALAAARAAGFVLRPGDDDTLWAWPGVAAVDPLFAPAAPELRVAFAGAALSLDAFPLDDDGVEVVATWLEGAPLHRASLHHRACEAARRAGRTGAARAQQIRGIEALSAAEQPPAALRGLLLMDGGLIALQEGVVPEARVAFAEAVASLETAHDDGAAPVLEHARLALAQATALGSELAAAEGLFRAGIDAVEARGDLDPEDPTQRALAAGLAVARMNLGGILLGRGDVSAALRLLREAWEDWEDLAEPDDPDGASFTLALAQGLRAAGRGTEIDEPLERARVLSGGDMDRSMRATLPQALHDLGVAAGDRGDWQAAATLVDEASMMAMSLLPQGHPDRARFAYTRGLLYLAQGDLAAARRQQEKALDLLEDGQAPAVRELVRAALAWTRAREGAHRHPDARDDLEQAGAALEALRGAGTNAGEHVRILLDSLG
jgi:tetratricopeptide (TPR) repeat protein